jgi:hypothetical protein
VSIALTLVDALLKDLYLFGGGGLIAPALSRAEITDRVAGLFLESLRRQG